MTEPKFTYDVKRVSREALEDLADFNISYYTTGHCGPKLQRVFYEARVPVPPTAAELQAELYNFLYHTLPSGELPPGVDEMLDGIAEARKREAGQ